VARSALADIVHVEELPEADGLGISLYRPLEAGPRMLRAKLFRAGRPLMLSDVLPLFENMGVQVADERPYPIAPRGRDGVWVYDFGLTHSGDGDLDTGGIRESFQDTFVRAWRGEVENDSYNRLVLGAALTWREITVLRAIGKYLRQARITYSDSYVEQALVAHPEIARLLVALFQARFDPRRTDRADAGEIAERIGEAIDAVESLDQDQILRMFLAVIQAILRTNYFQTGPTEAASHLSFKLDPTALRWLPQPRPAVRDLRVLAPHRGRASARRRGGARRHPVVGSARGLPHRGARPDEGPDGEERRDRAGRGKGRLRGEAGARAPRGPAGGGGGLLPDLHPRPARPDGQHPGRRGLRRRDVVRYDGDDPYLVVAADKGTATFSDIANGIALEYGFWLGDAFASGGSPATTTRRWASPRAARGSP
jgi:glutamate dehydrogenase